MSEWKGTLELNEPLSVEIMATITDAEYENTERLLITTPSGKKVEFIKADAFRWTPVSEGLPEEKKTVIASSEYGVYPEARYTKENGWEWAYESGADYWEKLECVTAWMPLPKQYEPQQESE